MKSNDDILKQKLAIVLAVNTITLALDAGANYYIYNKQLNDVPSSSLFSPSLSSLVTQLTGNNVKGVCYALGAYADVQYVIGNDAKCDADDLVNISTNFPWLVLHLSKSIVRALEIANR